MYFGKSVLVPEPCINPDYSGVIFSAETAELDLDGQGGRMFLRVLLNLVMHNYPALVSGALQLLFRHFSQRQEVLQAFKQVSQEETEVVW